MHLDLRDQFARAALGSELVQDVAIALASKSRITIEEAAAESAYAVADAMMKEREKTGD